MPTSINIADLKCPDDRQGRSYREVNAEKLHKTPINTLVELESGVRAFVIGKEDSVKRKMNCCD